jgi:hypothetical protein
MKVRVSAQQIDIEVMQYNAVSPIVMNFKNADGSPANITGWKVFFTVKKNLNDADALAVINKTISAFTIPANGVCPIPLTTTDMALDAGVYYYDVKHLDTASNQATDLYGSFIVMKATTIRTS